MFSFQLINTHTFHFVVSANDVNSIARVETSAKTVQNALMKTRFNRFIQKWTRINVCVIKRKRERDRERAEKYRKNCLKWIQTKNEKKIHPTREMQRKEI